MKRSKIAVFGLFVIVFLIMSINYDNIENLETSKPVDFSSRKDYDSNNYDVQYHDTIAEIEDKSSSGSWLIGKSGKLEYMPWSKIASQATYYEGKYMYGGTTWVPTYLDSILLKTR